MSKPSRIPNLYHRGDLLTNKDTAITYGVISAPFVGTEMYTLRTYGGEDDSEPIHMSKRLVESGRFSLGNKVQDEDKLLPCPFCGGQVGIAYDAVTSFSIDCCTSMSLQICDALGDAGKTYEPVYQYDMEANEYPVCSQNICREALHKAWNQRAENTII